MSEFKHPKFKENQFWSKIWKILAEKLPTANRLDILNLVQAHVAAYGGLTNPKNYDVNHCDFKNCQRIWNNIDSNLILTKSKLFKFIFMSIEDIKNNHLESKDTETKQERNKYKKYKG